MKGQGLLLAIVTAVVIAAVVLGFLVLGTPGKARRETLDRQRVDDLQVVVNHVRAMWNVDSKKPLPATLEAAMAGERPKSRMRDPVTKELYGYRVLGATKFEVCATFDTEVKEEDLESWNLSWAHPAGRHCFTIDLAGPERGP